MGQRTQTESGKVWLLLQVHVKANQTLKIALKKAMAMRDLTTSQCVAYVVQPNKPLNSRHMVDWAICTTALAGQEVGGAG